MTLTRLDTIIAFVVVVLAISLMITVLNQIIASVLGLRGRNLKTGIIDLLNTLDPSLNTVKKVEDIVTQALTHKLVSDSTFARIQNAPERWRLATAVGADELGKVLKLCADKTYAGNIDKILSEVNPALEREVSQVAGVVNAFGITGASADQLIKQITDKTSQQIGRFEAAFNSTMDRIAQRFTLQMRIWTVVFAVLIAGYGHIDAFRLYSQVSTEPGLRASLANASDSLLKKAAEVTPQNKDATVKTLAEDYNSISKTLAQTGFQITNKPKYWYCYRDRYEVAGILVMVAFLSLGSPFWYNVLKGLTNLRPMATKKQPQEQSGD